VIEVEVKFFGRLADGVLKRVLKKARDLNRFG
jgi:hypothetical protein